MNRIMSAVTSWMHTPEPPKRSVAPPQADPRTTEIYTQAGETLEPLFQQTTLERQAAKLTLSTPAIGEEPLQLATRDGQTHATWAGQELPVKHRGPQGFVSTHGAHGVDPATDTVQLPNGREVKVTRWDRSLEVEVKAGNNPVTLDLWFNDGESPSSVKLRQPGLAASLDQDGVRLDERPRRDGPLYGHLTEMRNGQFESRDWNDGFCDPAPTSAADVARVLENTHGLLSAGGALFAGPVS